MAITLYPLALLFSYVYVCVCVHVFSMCVRIDALRSQKATTGLYSLLIYMVNRSIRQSHSKQSKRSARTENISLMQKLVPSGGMKPFFNKLEKSPSAAQMNSDSITMDSHLNPNYPFCRIIHMSCGTSNRCV